MDLGYKSDMHGGLTSGPESKDKPKTAYPSIMLRGPAAEAFCRACSAGETLEGGVRVKVVRISDGVPSRAEYASPGDNNQSVELEIESLDLPGVGKPAMEDETPEDAVDKYRARKEAPDDEEMD